MSKLSDFKKHLKRGKVYRRGDLEQWSTSVDRHLKELLKLEELQKVGSGLYYYPKQGAFGNVPADDEMLVKIFLKDDYFLLTTPNDYNRIGSG